MTSLCLLLTKFCRIKPIFHCDAKLLALGTFASGNAKNSTFALAPMPTPDASQWNIGGVGSQRKILALAMSFFVCRFHSPWVANANPISSGIWS